MRIGSVAAASRSSTGNMSLANSAVPGIDRFRVEPNATVLPRPLPVRWIHLRWARLNGISSRSMAKKYWRKNSPSWVNSTRKRPSTG